MTNKEAAIWLRDHIDATPDGTKQSEAIEMAIKALEQQPCEDCISRKRVIMLIDEAAEKNPYKIIGLPNTYSDYNQGWTDACDWLYANIESDDLPSVTPRQKSGKWIRLTNDLAQCSNCGDYVDNAIRCGYNFCPNCGARMVEPIGK